MAGGVALDKGAATGVPPTAANPVAWPSARGTPAPGFRLPHRPRAAMRINKSVPCSSASICSGAQQQAPFLRSHQAVFHHVGDADAGIDPDDRARP
jgi:hypothetical protein